MKTYETDVLVVGGGGAATASTIAAHDAGARTMMAVKGQFGVPGVRGAGATSNPRADFWTIRTVGPKGGLFNPPEATFQDMLQTGLGMADPVLCKIFVEEVTEAIKRLRGMGMRFQSKMLATMPATEKSKGTNNIVLIQKAVIEGTNTQVLEHANLTDLVVERGRCKGAVGIDDDGEPFVVHAGAVILATGGVGQLFKHSFNPPGNTGDGYAMALRAGAALFNMEFMQQGLATTWPTQCIAMLYEMDKPYRMLNRNGKAFLGDWLPDGMDIMDVSKDKAWHWPVSCRDRAIHLDRAIHGEALAGRATENDAVYLDLAGTQRGFQPEVFLQYMKDNGIDIGTDLLQVQIHHHTSNGGIRINTDAQSPFVEGLFAVGEAAGWQGADRLGGTMLGGSQVFGWRAGAKAADVARDRPQGTLHADDFDRLLGERLARQRQAKGTLRPAQLHRDLQQRMWELLLVEKDAAQLNEAQGVINTQRARLRDDLLVAEPFDHVLTMELRNMMHVAEAITQAALLRTESRGAHYRSDFPQRDDANWMSNIFVSRDGQGNLELRKEWINEECGWDDVGKVRIQPWG